MSFVGKWFGFGRDEQYDRGVRAFESGMYEDAIEHFAKCVDRSSDPAAVRLARFYTAESYAQLGIAALRSESYIHAVRFLAKAVELHPNFPDLRFHMSVAYGGLGDRQGQKREIERALALNPKYARAVLAQGILLYEESYHDEGLARVAEAIDIEPNLDAERYRFARECHECGDTVRALANLQTLANPNTSDANSHVRAADKFARDGLWVEAAQEYLAALEIAPRYADIRCRYGQALLQLDHVEPAAEQMRLALEINPQYADAHAYLGIALRRQGDEPHAKESFATALSIDPHHVVASEEASRLHVI